MLRKWRYPLLEAWAGGCQCSRRIVLPTRWPNKTREDDGDDNPLASNVEADLVEDEAVILDK